MKNKDFFNNCSMYEAMNSDELQKAAKQLDVITDGKLCLGYCEFAWDANFIVCPDCGYEGFIYYPILPRITDRWKETSSQGWNHQHEQIKSIRQVLDELKDASKKYLSEPCPICKSTNIFHFPAIQGLSSEDSRKTAPFLLPSFDQDPGLAKIRKKKKDLQDTAISNRLSEIENAEQDPISPNKSVPGDDIGELKKYLANVAQMEINKSSLTEMLRQLYNKRYELGCEFGARQIEHKASQTSFLHMYQRKLDTLNDEIIEIDPQEYAIEKPESPSKPVFNQKKPVTPYLEKPGLFNRKAVLAENERREEKYKTELKQFEAAQAKYNEELQNYYQQESNWQNVLEEIKQEEEKRKQELLLKKQKQKDEKIQDLQQKIKERSVINEESLENDKNIAIVDSEIDLTENLLKETIRCLNQLYAADVIYGKYRNVVAVTSFNDYFMSGRCNALEGTNGAYNLFEQEVRSNLVIQQLSDIKDSLESIKSNQYLLYNQLSESNKNLQAIQKTLEDASDDIKQINESAHEIKKTMKSVDSHTYDIKQVTKEIANTSALNAHFAELSAYYQKKNAELTNSLGYLIALK